MRLFCQYIFKKLNRHLKRISIQIVWHNRHDVLLYSLQLPFASQWSSHKSLLASACHQSTTLDRTARWTRFRMAASWRPCVIRTVHWRQSTEQFAASLIPLLINTGCWAIVLSVQVRVWLLSAQVHVRVQAKNLMQKVHNYIIFDLVFKVTSLDELLKAKFSD